MKKLPIFVIMTVLATSLMACSTVKRFTGEQDNSVLPGTREEILPPDQQTARDPEVTGNKTAPCNPDDIDCVVPSGDQETSEIGQESSTVQ
jgi:hypothetical protein